MATSLDYIIFVCDNLSFFENIRYRKMFGEYMVYCNDKPVLLVCDNTVYVKMVPELEKLMHNSETDAPYNGAKLHYILDIENVPLAQEVVTILESITPIPKKRKRKQI